MNDGDEVAADTDPWDSASILSLLNISHDGGHIHVDWKGGEWATQYIEYCESLMATSAQWTVIHTNLPKTAISNSLDYAPGSNGSLFFRIRATR